MRVNEHNAVVLSNDETTALAMLIVTRKLEDAADWLVWEDIPRLDEDGFARVVDAIRAQAGSKSIQLLHFERSTDIDSRQIYGWIS